ncbi:MAG: hypothetical protein KGJ86_00905 [Chloroflexota bacterium]|nr:hypothetical protein [Chloroflexota bacterium]
MDQETQLNLAQDVPAVIEFLQENDGTLTQDETLEGVYWLKLRPRTALEEWYFVKSVWARYPHRPPSVRFATAVNGDLNSTKAWPLIPGYRPSSFDICKPFTAEGYALHSDWKTGPSAWPTSGNPFLWVVQTLQFDLDNSYGGRSA